MKELKKKEQLNQILGKLVESLDISEADFIKAEKRYDSISDWMNRDDSSVKGRLGHIYPQGSFMLGTVIKPTSDNDDYDIDLVCEFDDSKDRITQKELKENVGTEVKSYAEANGIKKEPKDKRRSWRLDYVENFHIDLLPALPNGEWFKIYLAEKQISTEWAELAIAITDNKKDNYCEISCDWLPSNPRGYAEWFIDRMKKVYSEQQERIAKAMDIKIEEVPKYKIKTPLQKAIQLLKRHRDIMFEDDEDKPISIIITTLAARAYENQDNICDALINIIDELTLRREEYIPFIEGEYRINNPVNKTENFADKWKESLQKKENFDKWLKQVGNDFTELRNMDITQEISKKLENTFGSNIVKKTYEHIQEKETNYPKVEINNPTRPWSR
ncbi:nucleotidyltransferase [bacterium]|nr:nucleotidyltransferase [bacterium]